MTRNEYFIIKEKTKEIMDIHETLSVLNRRVEYEALSQYCAFKNSVSFRYNGHLIKVVQEVTTHEGRLKYVISYYQDGKRIPHNIIYIKKLYKCATMQCSEFLNAHAIFKNVNNKTLVRKGYALGAI